MKIQRRFALAFVLSAMLMLTTGTAHAGLYARHYVVHYTCVISPPAPDPSGEWDVDCDGNWTGWGDMPFSSYCVTWEMTPTDYCGP